MRKTNPFPYARLVFDRKNRATTSNSAHAILGTVHVEVTHLSARKWYSTGVRCYKNQWNKRISKVVNHPQQVQLNERLDAIMQRFNDSINVMLEDFSFVKLENMMNPQSSSFLDFMESRISERRVSPGTRKHHVTVLAVLRQFGKIVEFSDLVTSNIVLFNDFLLKREIRQTTIRNYHKILKVFISEAIARDMLQKSPYLGFKVDRGKSEGAQPLTATELEILRNADLNESLSNVRNLFLFQCNTGLAYADLAEFRFSDLSEHDGHYWLKKQRVKTNEWYYVMMNGEAMEILALYNNVLPVLSNQKYNLYLHAIQERLGISKNMTSHMGRKTFATMMLEKGVAINVVQHMLGHSKVTTTEIYAKTMDKSIEDAFLKQK